MSLYNNFIEETNADVLWKKIDVVFENKNVINRVSVFWKIVRLRYQDGSRMAEHLNAFQGLAFLLLRSLQDSWETLVVTLGNTGS